MTLLVDGIGRLVTNGPEGELADAWIVIDGEHVVERRDRIATGRR